MRIKSLLLLLAVSASALWRSAGAQVLPEDRFDALYHRYDGGGVTVDGPATLVRKQLLKDVSVSAEYYVDEISSASIDVMSTASPYSERREQYSLGADYLHNETMFSIGYTNSDESDYTANSAYFSISQDVFGGLTTLTMGYSRGWDDVGMSSDPQFSEEVDRENYRLGLTQVLTRNAILNLAWETITDEGYLNNPYRSVRYLDPSNPVGFSWQGEVYPNTRTSNAAAVRGRYFLPYRAALYGEYRYFNDTWGISAHTGEVGYTHPFTWGLTVDMKYRYYTQGAADFYSDLFPREDAQNYMARDKELSEFTSHTMGVAFSYEILSKGWHFVDKGTVNFNYDRILFDYEDFRNVLASGAPGSEPLYDFSADVFQFFLSFWF